MRELEDAVRIIGYDSLHLLGYRDSGMPDTDHNADPENFANADLDEAVGRLVRIVRAERPQVMITYSNEQGGYSHPDHIRVHEISVLAFERAGDPEWYPEAGEPWQVLKLYYSSGFSAGPGAGDARLVRRQRRGEPLRRLGRPLARRPRRHHDHPHRRRRVHGRRARRACSRTRPRSRPTRSGSRCRSDVARDLHPWEDFVLARSLVESASVDGEFETDLFAGVRVPSTS